MFNANKNFLKKESNGRLIDNVIDEAHMDELFTDYYRHRDNSVLQLVMLLFSKAKVTDDKNVPNVSNEIDASRTGFTNIKRENSVSR